MACTSVHCSSALDKTQPVVMPEISALAVSGDGSLENVGIGVHLTPKLSVVGGCPNFRRSVLGRIEAAFLPPHWVSAQLVGTTNQPTNNQEQANA